jgi:hypothetical protein
MGNEQTLSYASDSLTKAKATLFKRELAWKIGKLITDLISSAVVPRGANREKS